MKLNYRLTETKCIKLSKEIVYFETDNPIEIYIDIPPIYRKNKLTATVKIDDTPRELPIVALAGNQYLLTLPNATYPQKIEFVVRSNQIWTADPIEVRSLNELAKEAERVLPEYSAATIKLKEMELRVKALEDKHQIIL